VKRILVTGAGGFIGFNTAVRLAELGHSLFICDTFNRVLYPEQEKKDRVKRLLSDYPTIKFIDLDITSNPSLLSVPEVDVIVNAAAIPGLATSWSHVEDYFMTNAVGPDNLLRCVLMAGPSPQFIQLSTSSVYGQYACAKENSPLDPTSPYGISKLSGEKLLLERASIDNVNLQILRLFSVYGPEQRPDMAIRKFIEAIWNGTEIHLTSSGSHKRSFTFVDDVTFAIVQAINYGGEVKIFNIGGSESTSVIKLIEELEDLIGKRANLKNMPNRPGDQIETKAETSLAKLELNFESRVSLRKGLESQINWQLSSRRF
jgi:UDP-glucuronate 4-epimerase